MTAIILPKKTVQEIALFDSEPLEQRSSFIKLNLNENTLGFPEIFGDKQNLLCNFYPDYSEICADLANFFHVSSKELLLSNGAEEAISIIANTFIEPAQDCAVVSKPCFSQITRSLKLAGAQLLEIPVKDDFSFDLAAIENILESSPKIAVFSSPDNPTGGLLETSRLLWWCKVVLSPTLSTAYAWQARLLERPVTWI